MTIQNRVFLKLRKLGSPYGVSILPWICLIGLSAVYLLYNKYNKYTCGLTTGGMLLTVFILVVFL